MSETPGNDGPSNPPYPGQGQGYPPPPPNAGQPAYPPGPSGYPAPSQGYPPGQGYPPPPGYPQAGPGGYPGYPGYPGYDDRSTRTGWSGWAIAAFVVGLVLPLVGILIAVPLGIVALVKIRGTRQKGKALAIIGMVLSVLWWVGIIGLGVYVESQQAERDDAGIITKAGRIDFGDIRAGDCVRIPDPGGDENIDTFGLKGVPCEESHNAQAAKIIAISGPDYPGQDSLDSQSAQPCIEAVAQLAAVAGGGYQPYRLIPTEAIWKDDSGHRVICFVTKVDFGDFTGSLSN